jgi:hypothetical protein
LRPFGANLVQNATFPQVIAPLLAALWRILFKNFSKSDISASNLRNLYQNPTFPQVISSQLAALWRILFKIPTFPQEIAPKLRQNSAKLRKNAPKSPKKLYKNIYLYNIYA